MRRSGRSVTILVAAILAVSLARADAVRLLDDPRGAARARVDLIRSAKTSIDAMYFIVGDDSVSLAVLALLRDAARAGVPVRLVVDGHFNRIPEAVQSVLIRDGVTIKEYQPFRLWKPRGWTRRLHDKLLIIDGDAMITGGRNIEAPYYGRGHEVGRRDYLDRDVLVEGSTAAEASAYFDALWNGDKVHKTDLGRFRRKQLDARCELRPESPDRLRCERLKAESLAMLDEAAHILDAQRDALDHDPLFRPEAAAPWPEKHEVPVRFLHDPATGKRAGSGIGVELLQVLDGARSEIVIESPYLVPSRALRRSLRAAVARGVKIRVLTNSMAATDNVLAQAGYQGRKDNVVRWGIELWEYGDPECLHTKSVVIDDAITVIGSFNLDPRSEYLNTEVAVVIDDPVFARSARRAMDDHLSHAWRIGADGRPTGEGATPVRASCGRRATVALLRLLAPFIQKQL